MGWGAAFSVGRTTLKNGKKKEKKKEKKKRREEEDTPYCSISVSCRKCHHYSSRTPSPPAFLLYSSFFLLPNGKTLENVVGGEMEMEGAQAKIFVNQSLDAHESRKDGGKKDGTRATWRHRI